MPKKITTILFDIDGTLVDSNDSHAHSWVDALAQAGFPVPYGQIRPLIGLGSDAMFPTFNVGLAADREPGKSILKRRRQIFLERYVPKIQSFPGARALVATLKTRGYTLIVASSASEEELTPLLRIAGVEGLFDHAMPAPDIVHAALAWSDTPREGAVMIGDSRYDMQAAHDAGIAGIGLRCGGTSDADLAPAVALFDDPADLLRALGDGGFDELLNGVVTSGGARRT